MQQENEQFDELPQALIDELKAADQALPLITARVDREILQMAELQFAKRRSTAWRSRPAWAAIAATVLIALTVVSTREPLVDNPTSVYADVDRSGRVDIADVLALARAAGSRQVTQAEIDAFAMQIVSLNPVGDAS
jgi:anti-sigma-K factor RskA